MNRNTSKNIVGMLVLLILLIMAVVGVYMFGERHYSTHFLAGTTINGVDVGEMTADDVRYELQNRIREYTLTCNERNGQVERITGEDIYMQYVDDGSIERLLEEQNPKLWILSFGNGRSYTTEAGFVYDKSSIDRVLDNMNCFKAENVIAPTNAHVMDDGVNFVISPGGEGTTLNRDRTKYAIVHAIETGATTLDFDEQDLYVRPAATAENANLQAMAEELNKMVHTNIVYDFTDRQYVVDGRVVRSFMVEDENHNLILDEQKVADWVKNMAYETDTFGLAHDFTTTSGVTIKLEAGGDYGWVIKRDQTTQELIEGIRNGVQETREPAYLYKAVDRSRNDIGGTYAEVCIEQQKLWLYKDGALILETPVVTGSVWARTNTPSGSVWAIDGKTKHYYFRASRVWVDYWLPFNEKYEVGLHDADGWRRAYGGNIYLRNGSHGCVNIPGAAMKEIYATLDIGYPVVVYYSVNRVKGDMPTAKTRGG